MRIRLKCRLNPWPAIALLAGLAWIPLHACTLDATSLGFGTINPLTAVDHESTSDISVTCPESTTYSLALSAGAGSFEQRLMEDGGQSLEYNLYTDSAHTQIWGDGSGISVTVSGTADSSGQTHTVYGLLPHQNQAVPGTYGDSITVTLTY